MRTESADWLFYTAIGLLVIVAASKVAFLTTPDHVRRALNDPTTVYFSATETAGKACRDMADEARRRGSTHWVCHSWGRP